MTVATRAVLDALATGIKADLEHARGKAAALEAWRHKAPVGYEAQAAAVFLHHLYGSIESIVAVVTAPA